MLRPDPTRPPKKRKCPHGEYVVVFPEPDEYFTKIRRDETIEVYLPTYVSKSDMLKSGGF